MYKEKMQELELDCMRKRNKLLDLEIDIKKVELESDKLALEQKKNEAQFEQDRLVLKRERYILEHFEKSK